MLNHASVETTTRVAGRSTGVFAGARPMAGADAAIAEPVVAQNGQKCEELPLADVRSAQK